MKDNVSIILAAIIGTILIVILPLYSVLDRQDSTSYNVVLTLTTNFVDNIRTKGFIDKKTYTEYIQGLATTGNTYKVEIEAHRKTLIHDVQYDKDGIPEYNADGSIKTKEDTFVEDTLIDNTYDIMGSLEQKELEEKSNRSNTYLLKEGDEIYVKVYNTNITSGSIIYGYIAGSASSKVIDISYGGVINNVNWDLYETIEKLEYVVPEVIVGLPKNGLGESNVTLSYEQGEFLSIEEETGDAIYESIPAYSYVFDLTKTENKTLSISVELRNFTKLLGENITTLTDEEFINFINNNKDKIMQYIKLDGVYADMDVVGRLKGDYYKFNIILRDIRLASLTQVMSIAKVNILPGLGQGSDETESIGAQTVEFVLMDKESAHSVAIYGPYGSNTEETNRIENPLRRVYFGQSIYFIIEYTGVAVEGNKNEIISILNNAINNNTDINYANSSNVTVEVEPNFPEDANQNDDTVSYTGRAKISFIYTLSPGEDSNKYIRDINYISLRSGWITTRHMEDDTIIPAFGAESDRYPIFTDNTPPSKPFIDISGTLGKNDWYTSDIRANIINGEDPDSGVNRTTYKVSGTTNIPATEGEFVDISSEGSSTITAYTYDNVGNVSSETKTIRIDKTAPTAPEITVASGDPGNNGWYTSAVTLDVTPGRDNANMNQSGISKTTYEIEGANATTGEVEGTNIVLSNAGTSIVRVYTYDNAGNRSRTILEVKIDEAEPTKPSIEIIAGTQGTNGWYTSNVVLKLKGGSTVGTSGIEKTIYKVSGGMGIRPTEFIGEFNLTLNVNGRNNITVETHTKAGKVSTETLEVKIDKDAPNEPLLTITSGTLGEEGWYISNVGLKVTSAGDNGPSGIVRLTYKISTSSNQNETVISNGDTINITQDGQNVVTVYAYDVAGLRTSKEITIRKDTTAPIAGNIIVEGDASPKEEGWYISAVDIYYGGTIDATSGVKEITLSHDRIDYDTSGTNVTLTVKDNAGNISTISKLVKVDVTGPSNPQIILPEVSGTGILDVSLYNYFPTINIIAGTGTIDGQNIIADTTYEVIKQGVRYITEKAGTQFEITEDGLYTVIARTYDKYGKVSTISKAVWIETGAPNAPTILTINSKPISELPNQTFTGTSPNYTVGISNLEEGAIVKVESINMDTYQIKEELFISDGTTDTFNITLVNKGKYKVTAKQTNIFGTTSSTSSQICYYQYN